MPSATRLEPHVVCKPWGRRDIPAHFAAQADGESVGEIWFEPPDRTDQPLLVKYLFTSEKLSIQVHPDDGRARRIGLKHGKDEGWFVLWAEQGARIGFGLKREVDRATLRQAALDGSIEELMDWRPVTAGEFIYSPGGTIHALGAGLMVVEIQQNLDLTWRLFDYGRPRELHVEEAIEAAIPRRADPGAGAELISEGLERLVDGPSFSVERWMGRAGSLRGGPSWLVPIDGTSTLGPHSLHPGSVWLAHGGGTVETPATASLLVARPR